ncbi:1,6-anhydro-N-acetylmuramyl-L-alanine amidase AmpD [Litorilituus lipolyticus]|uniref:1,6-anhydro-N-acetylmuramyl-L-alanine amidase AmpD n=1 Tax=Litorilituus lipolyticus TaxID=2491017 RepID=A0A502KX06_9GAMM|nr:1,6-anhydro-N-acetylmuramyl-L-alanine amidase AmpD [Litorilituus lipolyticus]TPH16188.1 1,6-anhydro-N-acetylmuramyl-L-alanine amidase AmpD [Litorilituus lipolyticus]
MTLIQNNKDELCNNLQIKQGWLTNAEQCISPHFTPRDKDVVIDLLVIHNISLPAGKFGGPYITDLFMGNIDVQVHPSFCDLAGVRVSAHCLIRRDGSVIQYVSFDDKAWHAGVSCFNNKERCNDFSIGIELEGADNIDYCQAQYQQLANITASLMKSYPAICKDNIVGHCDIAPGRKTDPGEAFDWEYFHRQLAQLHTEQE